MKDNTKEIKSFQLLDEVIAVLKDGYCAKEVIRELCSYYNLEKDDIFPEEVYCDCGFVMIMRGKDEKAYCSTCNKEVIE